ncbi:MAG: TetR/AcrR family transcriptional regulator [Defluviitaleaceae bacterium]|nr:TetR/AcrR family transcriptional regulator [Defluviitaleaceae bacterium]
MPKNPEKNAQIREERRNQILDATLSVYIRFGYHGTDMDIVAKEAGLAKGLVYYYIKTKQELFAELYTQMFGEGYSFSEALLKNAEGLNPVEQLMAYAYGIFAANRENPRMMQFFIRVPFDAYAIFGAEKWKEGAQKSDMHRKALASIIKKGISEGLIPEINPDAAANSFWSVFVANVFAYSKLMTGAQESLKNEREAFKDVVRFCFQGLGIEYSVWNTCLVKSVNGGESNESI